MIVIGPPGCGKGTQSANIVKKYGLTHISTGDILREEVELHTAIGEIVKKFLDRGYLVPDDIVMREIFETAIKQKCDKGLLFDGFPRTLFQADYLDDIMYHRNEKINLVIHLNVEEEELFQRIVHRSEDAKKRSDDNEETVRNRLQVYYQKTFPLLEYYKKKHKLVTISGMAPIQGVFNAISSIIDDYINKS